jgi:hypothetical protein
VPVPAIAIARIGSERAGSAPRQASDGFAAGRRGGQTAATGQLVRKRARKNGGGDRREGAVGQALDDGIASAMSTSPPPARRRDRPTQDGPYPIHPSGGSSERSARAGSNRGRRRGRRRRQIGPQNAEGLPAAVVLRGAPFLLGRSRASAPRSCQIAPRKIARPDAGKRAIIGGGDTWPRPRRRGGGGASVTVGQMANPGRAKASPCPRIAQRAGGRRPCRRCQ